MLLLFISFKTNLHSSVLLPCRFQQSERPTMQNTENMENVDFELFQWALGCKIDIINS